MCWVNQVVLALMTNLISLVPNISPIIQFGQMVNEISGNSCGMMLSRLKSVIQDSEPFFTKRGLIKVK